MENEAATMVNVGEIQQRVSESFQAAHPEYLKKSAEAITVELFEEVGA